MACVECHDIVAFLYITKLTSSITANVQMGCFTNNRVSTDNRYRSILLFWTFYIQKPHFSTPCPLVLGKSQLWEPIVLCSSITDILIIHHPCSSLLHLQPSLWFTAPIVLFTFSHCPYKSSSVTYHSTFDHFCSAYKCCSCCPPTLST